MTSGVRQRNVQWYFLLVLFVDNVVEKLQSLLKTFLGELKIHRTPRNSATDYHELHSDLLPLGVGSEHDSLSFLLKKHHVL